MHKANSGLKLRSKFVENSNDVQLSGRIFSDIFSIDKLLLSHIDVRIKLIQSKDNFVLISPDQENYKIHLKSAILRVRKVTPTAAVQLSHDKLLLHTPARYHYLQSEVNFLQLPRGHRTFTRDNICSNNLPRTILLGVIDDRGLNGHYQFNPYEFLLYSLNEVKISVDGIGLPGSSVELDHPDSLSGYNTLFASSIERLFANNSVPFGRKGLKGGYGLFLFDVAADACQEHLSPQSRGTVKVDLSFSNALDSNLNLMVLSTYDSFLQVNHNRQCFIET